MANKSSGFASLVLGHLHCNKKYAYAAALWALAIFAVSTAPGSTITPVASKVPFSSVLAHFGEFFIFGWLLSKAFPKLRSPLLISFSYSVITEVLQLYVPGRFFSYSDISMNIAGSIFGIGAPSAFGQNNILLQFKNKLTAWFNDRNP